MRHICLLLSLMIAGISVLSAQASGDDLEQAGARVESAEEEAKSLQEAATRLESYLEDLNSQLDQLTSDIEDLAAQKSELDSQLAQTNEELEAARETEAVQYANMKKRIQYMYENRDAGFVGLIFSEESLSGIMNKAEYAMEMVNYDRQMLTAYKETKDLIAQKESDILTEKEALNQIVQETEEKKNEVLAAIGETAEKMEECAGNLEDTKGQLAQYRAELQRKELEAEARMDELDEEPVQVADGSSQGGESTSGNGNAETPTEAVETPTKAPVPAPTEVPTEAPTQAPAPTEPPTEAPTQAPTQAPGPGDDEIDYTAYSDLELLAAMIYREAGGEPWQGKVAVGNVIMNRIRSSRYPNTMLGVLSQPYQFSPWGNPKYINALKNGVNSTCMQAAEVAMNGTENYIGDLLHFRTASSGYTGIIIGGHVFY